MEEDSNLITINSELEEEDLAAEIEEMVDLEEEEGASEIEMSKEMLEEEGEDLKIEEEEEEEEEGEGEEVVDSVTGEKDLQEIQLQGKNNLTKNLTNIGLREASRIM